MFVEQLSSGLSEDLFCSCPCLVFTQEVSLLEWKGSSSYHVTLKVKTAPNTHSV